MSSPSAILFDMDGVLIRGEEARPRVLEDAGRRFRGVTAGPASPGAR